VNTKPEADAEKLWEMFYKKHEKTENEFLVQCNS